MTIYFAQVGPYIKIGFSRNPERRVRRLFSSATPAPADCPRDLASRRLLRTIPGDLSVERAVHAAVDDFRVAGEFFLGEPEVYAFVTSVHPDAFPFAKIDRPAGKWEPPPPSEADLEELDRILAAAFGRPGRGAPPS